MIVMLISMATGIGLQRRITEKITRFTGDMQVVPYLSAQSEQAYLPNADSIIRSMRGREDLLHIHRVSEKGGLLKTEDDFEGVTVKGVGSDFNWLNFSPYLKEGRHPAYSDEVYNDSILVSKLLMSRLKLELGDEVVVFFVRDAPKPPLMRRFVISGVFKTGMAEFDASFIIVHEKHLRKINKWEDGAAVRLELFTEKPGDAARRFAEWRDLLPLNADLRTSRESYPEIFQWLDLFDVNIYIILLVMVLVALVNSATALLTIILEKRKGIGLLKALGASESQLRRLFRLRSMYIVIAGMLWGNIIGIGLCLLQHFSGIIQLDPDVYYVDRVPIHLDPVLIIALNLGILLISYLAMNLPVRVIARMNPAESLKSF